MSQPLDSEPLFRVDSARGLERVNPYQVLTCDGVGCRGWFGEGVGASQSLIGVDSSQPPPRVNPKES